jgi:hypothetical protein
MDLETLRVDFIVIDSNDVLTLDRPIDYYTLASSKVMYSSVLLTLPNFVYASENNPTIY